MYLGMSRSILLLGFSLIFGACTHKPELRESIDLAPTSAPAFENGQNPRIESTKDMTPGESLVERVNKKSDNAYYRSDDRTTLDHKGRDTSAPGDQKTQTYNIFSTP